MKPYVTTGSSHMHWKHGNALISEDLYWVKSISIKLNHRHREKDDNEQ